MSLRTRRLLRYGSGVMLLCLLAGGLKAASVMSSSTAAVAAVSRGPVIFAGSSSIERWSSLKDDFAGHALINRGVGGSQLSRVLATFEQEILAEKPSLLVLYVGENDLAAGLTPAQVIADFDSLAERLRAGLPETRVVVLSIKPSPSRWSLHGVIEETNALLKDRVARNPGMRYVDVYKAMLNEVSEPRPELYYDDQLHLSAEGYKLWADQVRPLLGTWPTTPEAGSVPAGNGQDSKPVVVSAAKVVASVQ